MTLLKKLLAPMLAITIVGCTTPNTFSVSTTQKLVQHERSKADLTTKTYTLASGDKIVYAENNNVSGDPLLLIHGFGGNKDNFVRVAGKLQDYHIVIPDLLGFGDSDKPMMANYQSEAQAKRLHELMQAKGMQSNLHVGGNSMGGAISVAYASMYPNEVESLWLIDTAGFWSVGVTKELENSTLEDNPLLIDDVEDYYNLYDFVMNKPPFIPRSVQAVFAQERISNRELEGKILKQIVVDSVEERAKIIAEKNIPTLVVWGDKDKVIKPETAPYITNTIPQAKVIIMPNVGHVPMLESVRQTANDYKEFRQSIDK